MPERRADRSPGSESPQRCSSSARRGTPRLSGNAQPCCHPQGRSRRHPSQGARRCQQRSSQQPYRAERRAPRGPQQTYPQRPRPGSHPGPSEQHRQWPERQQRPYRHQPRAYRRREQEWGSPERARGSPEPRHHSWRAESRHPRGGQNPGARQPSFPRSLRAAHRRIQQGRRRSSYCLY